MSLDLPKDKKLVPIGEAAEILGVSIDTIRRWDKSGKLHSQRLDGKNRYFSIEELESIKFGKPLSIGETSEKLGVSASTLRRLEKKGLIVPDRTDAGERIYNKKSLEKFLDSEYFLRKNEVAQKILEPLKSEKTEIFEPQKLDSIESSDHSLFASHIQNFARFQFLLTRTGLFLTFAFVLIVSIITIFFFLFPETTGSYFGYRRIIVGSTPVLGAGDINLGKVLGATVTKDILKPFSRTSLAIIKVVSPETFEKAVPSQAIDNINQILTVNETGNIEILDRLEIPDNSYLTVTDSKGEVSNLNAHYLQSRIPGDEAGNIVYLNEDGVINENLLPVDTDFSLTEGLIESSHIKNGAIINADIANDAINASKIEDNTVGVSELSGSLSFGSGDLIDLSSIIHSSTAQQGLILPNVANASPTSPISGEGYLAYDTANDQVIYYNGFSWGAVGSGDITAVTAGNGLTGGGTSGAVSLSISLTTSGGTGSTSSNSGLEVGSGGLALLKGCANNEILKWDDTSAVWQCASDSGGGGSSLTVEEGDSTIDATVTNIDFAAGDFIVSESPEDEANISIDYTNSKIVRSDQNESITGEWVFAPSSTSDITFTLDEDTYALVNQSVGGTSSTQGIVYTLTNSSSSGTQYGLYLDNAASTGTTDALLVIDNSDTDTAVTSAVAFIDAGGGFTNLFNVAGTLISTTEFALLDSGIALSELTDSGTLTAGTVDINGGNIDGTTIGASAAAAGTFTQATITTGALAVNSESITFDGATLTINGGGAVDIQDALTVDTLTTDTDGSSFGGSVTFNDDATFTQAGAETTDITNASLTDTSGGLDLNFTTVTDAVYGVNLDFNNDEGAAGSTSYAMLINVDDNATTNNDTVYGLYLDAENSGDDDTDKVPTALLVIDNSDTNNPVTAGIQFVNAGGGFTNDIVLQNGESISNGTNNQINLNTGTSGTLLLTSASSSTITNSTGALTINSASNLAINSADGSAITLIAAGSGVVDIHDDLDINPDDAQNVVINHTMGSANGNVDTLQINLTNDDAGSDVQRMLAILNTNTAANTVTDVGIVIDNAETTANSMTDYLLITTASADSITDAIDVSDSDLFNALNVGANTITGTTANLDFSNFDVIGSSGNTDIGGTITAGSGNTIITLSTGMIDADAITLAPNDGAGGTSSASGLEVGSDGLTLLQGCTDGQLLEWTDAGGWACAADDNSGGSTAWNSIADPTGVNSITFDDGETTTFVYSTTTGDQNAFIFDFNQVDDGAATDDFDAMRFDLTSESGDAGDTFDGLVINWENGTANTIMDSAIKIDNAETTASTMTDAIIITSSGVSGGVVDAIDVSATNITNALNVGNNNIVMGDGGALPFTDGTNTIFSIVDNTSANGGAMVRFGQGKTDTGDPATCTEGDVYYNDAEDSIKICHESNVWEEMDNNSDWITVKRKTADETVTSNTTVQNDDHLSFAVAASENWVFKYYMMVQAANTTPDVRVTVSTPASPTYCRFFFNDLEAGNSTADTACGTTVSSAAVTANDDSFYVGGSIDNGSNAGNVTLQWAQNTSSTSGTTVSRGSFLTAFKVQGADLAEFYPTKDFSMSEGDVVALDDGIRAGVKKSETAYQRNVLGVVSTKPGLALGDSDLNQEGTKPVPIALSGRVPIKVNMEGGEIKSGDYLTSSSTPGVAMKASRAGPVIGQSMISWKGTESDVGEVLGFIKNGYFNGESIGQILTESGQEKNSTNILNMLVYQGNDVGPPEVDSSEIFTDRVVAGVEVITPKITAHTIEADIIRAKQIEGFEIYTDNLSSLSTHLAEIQAQIESIESDDAGIDPTPTATPLLSLGTYDGLTINNNLDVLGISTFSGETEFKITPLFNSDTAGEALIKKGDREVEIEFEKEYLSLPKVSANITLNTNVGEDIENRILLENTNFIITKRSAKGFTIRLSKPAVEDITFSWIALMTKEGKVFESKKSEQSTVNSEQVTPSPEPTPEATTEPEPTETPSVEPSLPPSPLPESTPLE